MNLDRAIIDTVLALQEFSENGVPFPLIQKGVMDLMGKNAPSAEAIHRKVEFLLDYDGMLHRTEGGGFVAIDLDAHAFEVGIPANSANIASLKGVDLDEFVCFGALHGGDVVDVSEFFEDMF